MLADQLMFFARNLEVLVEMLALLACASLKGPQKVSSRLSLSPLVALSTLRFLLLQDASYCDTASVPLQLIQPGAETLQAQIFVGQL